MVPINEGRFVVASSKLRFEAIFMLLISMRVFGNSTTKPHKVKHLVCEKFFFCFQYFLNNIGSKLPFCSYDPH